MSDKSYPSSYRLNETAFLRLETFCDLTGMKKSEVVKAAIAQFIAPTLGTANVVHMNYNPHVRTQLYNIDLSKDKSRCSTTQEKKDEVQTWFKAFWNICENRQFAERVVKTISDKWEILKDKCPEECAEKYNEYCNTEAMRGREYKHPNSWINDGGYDNETKTNDGGLAYDVE